MSLQTYEGEFVGSDGKKPIAQGSRDAEVLRMVQEYWSTCQKNRMQYERQWYLNLSFYFGKQWVQWNSPNTTSDFGRLVEPSAPSWRVRLVVNEIRPIIRTELAKVCKEKPQAFVVPASTDDDDMASARAAEAIFEHLMRTLNVNKMIRRAMFWTLLCGTGFMKDWYDEDQVDGDSVKGSICLEPVTPFHLFVPNTQEEDLEHQPYVIHALAKDPEWVKANYGKDIQADSDAGAGLLEQKFLNAMGLPKTDGKKFVSVRECWIKPCNKFKKGALVTFTKDQILSVIEEWPYKYTDFPFTKFDHIPTGRFYGESVIPDLIPIQRELNRTRSQLLEARNRMSKPQLIAPRGSVDPNKMTSEPGLIIQYTPGFAKPEPLPLQNIPAYVTDEINRFKSDLQDISGQHDISKGQAPTGVTAATALSFLGEQDDSKIAPTIASLEEGVEKLGSHFLSHAQEFWTAQRTIRIIGDNGQYETFMFSKSDIQSASDLKIEAGSATPRSLAAKQAFIMELGKMQWITPERALKYMNMSETGKMYEELQLDSRQAQRENLKLMMGASVEPLPAPVIPGPEGMPGQSTDQPEMAQPDYPSMPPDSGGSSGPVEGSAMQQPEMMGMPAQDTSNMVTVNTWDNHEVHVQEHDNKRKGQDFEQASPEVKQAFETHVQIHKQLIAQAQGTPIMPGQPIPPAPGDSGQSDSQPQAPGQPIPGGEGPPGGNVVQPEMSDSNPTSSEQG